ncbi:hypothetical protein FG379_003675 [Cryptosporidium bovis]|uniref:uncharacterized protein n=1 Tax=Cryptosporidium bovis TaxID=310047 RepID=UPI00351A3D95|nr:hypothetical protein FG379_003675 [Cryptosporidium bovis]
MRNKIFSLLSALVLSACTVNATSVGVENAFPGYVLGWSRDLKNHFSRKGLKFVSDSSLEKELTAEISLDNFEVTCVALLQRTVKEFSTSSNKWDVLNLDSALEMCTLVNPWNSMECSGISGVYASYARSIQEFVRNRDHSKGDLRAACLLTTAIAPSRPFSPLVKGSIKSKCEEACSGDIGKTLLGIDSSFCSSTMDLCGAVDFTLYSAFNNLTEKQLGVAAAISILLSEGALGIRTTFREGCRFVLSLIQRGVFPSSSSSVSEALLQSSVSDFYKTKLQEVGLVSGGSSDSGDETLLSVAVSQIADAIKSVLDGNVESKRLRFGMGGGKPQFSIRTSVNSEVSPISAGSQTEDLSSVSAGLSDTSEFKQSRRHHDKSRKLSRVQQDWFSTISLSIRRGTKDINLEFDSALTEAVLNIDTMNVYSTCVSELKKSRLASYRKITDACRKIDPFSNTKCQKLSHFELMHLIKIKDELESSKDDLIVDLRDLCGLSSKMSLKSFIKDETMELSEMCVSVLRGRTFKSKYGISERSIRKVCERTDYFRYSACGEMAVNKSEKLSLVYAIASNLFSKKNDKERLQLIRESDNKLPSYVDICDAVGMMQTETIEDCVFEFRDSLKKFVAVSSIIDIEGACTISIGGPGIYGSRYPEYGFEDRYYPSYGYDRYRDGYYPLYPRTTVRRYYRDIENVPLVSSLPWSLSTLPDELRHSSRHIRQQYSESRKGFYRDSKGKVQFHDGVRYRLNGLWFIKIGDEWYIDRSDALDFIDVTPGDRRYQHFLERMYEKIPPAPGVDRPIPIYRRRGYDYYFGPGRVSYPFYGYSYLHDLYGKPGVSQGDLTPFGYHRCKECNSWTPYEHHHRTAGGPSDGVEVTTVDGPRFIGGNIVTTTTDYGYNGNVIREENLYHDDVSSNQSSNKRTVGTQTVGDMS